MPATLENAMALAKDNGINIIDFRLPYIKSAAHSETKTLILDGKRMSGNREATELIYHELGHFATGSFYTIAAPLQTWGRCEARADAWSIQHMCPADRIRKALKDGNRTYWELAEALDVSESFVIKAIDFYTRKRQL